jgi:DNA polymerase-3 subunit epsilon
VRDRGRHWSVLEYVTLDFETTGLDPDVDEVVSMGIVPITAGRIDLSRSVYAEAAHQRPAGRSGVSFHGLRPADLIDSPERAELEARLAESLRGRRIVAWAAWVESSFLASIFGESGRAWRSRIVDVRGLVAHLDHLNGAPVLPEESLVSCAVRFGVPPSLAHHALGDAVMTAQLFLVAASRLEQRGAGRARDLLDLGTRQRRP